ncbi:MAG: aldehyde dehydrogenase family protein [bacterium]
MPRINQETASVVDNGFPQVRAAQREWAQTPISHRLRFVRKLRSSLAEHALELAECSGALRNRPVLETLTAEVVPLAQACKFLEREAAKILRTRRVGSRGRPLWLSGVRSQISRDPFGVILIIGPGNYPLFLPGVQMIQALVAGNAVVVKPGVGGYDMACYLANLIVQSGVNPHLVVILPESVESAETAIAQRPDKVLFTGSATTGKKILAQLAPLLIPSTMELSGCDPVIILEDADLGLAAKAIAFGLLLNGGATCLAPRRVIVTAARVDEFITILNKELDERMAQNSFSDSNSNQLVTSLTKDLTSTLQSLVADAVSRGAEVISGSIYSEGILKAPLILRDVEPQSLLLKEDLFLPVLAIVKVATESDAIRMANECPYALGASIFSRDESATQRVGNKILTGVITINDIIIPTADARLPFGGRKNSGFGVTRGAEGLLELTTPKVTTITKQNFRPAYEQPLHGDENLFLCYLSIVHSARFSLKVSGLVRLMKTILQRNSNITNRL